MESIIEWCNNNSAFTSAILSIVGLILSVIAIVASICASKLPYKRKALIKTGTSYHFDGNGSSVHGYNVEITNAGNLPINISYLGFGWYM